MSGERTPACCVPVLLGALGWGDCTQRGHLLGHRQATTARGVAPGHQLNSGVGGTAPCPVPAFLSVASGEQPALPKLRGTRKRTTFLENWPSQAESSGASLGAPPRGHQRCSRGPAAHQTGCDRKDTCARGHSSR